jgi:hypothetical protein
MWLVYYSVSLPQLGLHMTHNPPRMKTNMTAIFCKVLTFKPYMYGRGIAKSAISVKMLGTATPMKYLGMSMQWPPTTVGSHSALIGVHVKTAAASFTTCQPAAMSPPSVPMQVDRLAKILTK